MTRLSLFALILALLPAFSACGSDEPEPIVMLPEGGAGFSDDDRLAADAALDTARNVAADSALSHSEPDTAVPERDWPAPGALAYATYVNDRYGYLLDYPDNLFQRDEALGQEHGDSFATADGSARLLVYASEFGGAEGLRSQYESELARDDQTVTYRVLKPNWFVVSGYEGPYVFYRRTFRSGDGLRTFRIRHLAKDKDYFKPITERLSFSFEG